MLNNDVLRVSLNKISLSQRQATRLVGGRARLFNLIEQGKIHIKKASKDGNSRWYLDAYEVLENTIL